MLSKTGQHAVRALIALAELPEGKYVGANAIAELICAPPNYLAKLLQRYSEEGLVVSQKGLNGGFRLARDPRAITLFEVLAPVEELQRWSSCVLGRGRCCDELPCRLHKRWKVIKESYIQLLSETTLAEVVE